MKGRNTKAWLALLVLLAVFLCSITAGVAVDRNGGSTQVQDVYFTSTIDGSLLHGRLYIPENATAAAPAPCVIYIHGNDGEAEKYSMISVEFARRGYVVFSVDLRGQGKSVGNTGFQDMATGKYDSLGADEAGEYIRALPFVNRDRIMVGGHSMGGVAAIRTAHNNPDWYVGLLLMGVTAADCGVSSDNTNLGPKAFDKSAAKQMESEDKMLPYAGDENNINILIVTGRDDGDAANHNGIVAFCGLESEDQFESGKAYGSYEEQNVRMNYQAQCVHNWEYMSQKVIRVVVDYLQNSMKAPNPIDAGNQVWMWRYVWTTVAMIALIGMLLPLGLILLGTEFFASVKTAEPAYKGNRGSKYWIFAVISALLPPALYFYGCNHSAWLNGKLFNIHRVNCTLNWALLVAAATVVIILAGFFLTRKKDRFDAVSLGLAYENGTVKNIFKSLLLAFIAVFAIYSLLAVTYRWSLVDVRLWNTSFRELNSVRMIRVLKYFLPFALCYLIASVNLYGLVRPKNGELSVFKEILINLAIQAPWYFIWAIWLGTNGLIRNGGLPYFAGSMYAFFWCVPCIMAIVSVISTFFNRKTGHVWVGAFISSFLVCWTLLGGLSRMV
ncbi:MAG: alpha/beta fold hydrolase [Clostridia bacterium]|nr:alpha/beta fold hydrolase [Clostridia bacterium]